MNTDIIAARRQHIQDNAPCLGCGATLASCEAQRGKDPTAPKWFGCCARGTALGPCQHQTDPAALLALLTEIESGTVRTVEQVTAEQTQRKAPQPGGMSWFEYLNQGEQWKPNGRPPGPIADMDPEWRHNAARFLERRAGQIGGAYISAAWTWFTAALLSSVGPSEAAADDIERDINEQGAAIVRDPVAWIRTTKLHAALVAGLPTKGKKAAGLAERARHWSTCPARDGSGDCRCEQIRAEHQHAEEIRLGAPEWTDD